MTRVPLTGHVAVVAGATSAIGQAVCTALAGIGMRLCLLGRDTHTLSRFWRRVFAARRATWPSIEWTSRSMRRLPP
jgi:NADP-dependent 3-hydroxy acid dehydrogenase YdfG